MTLLAVTSMTALVIGQILTAAAGSGPTASGGADQGRQIFAEVSRRNAGYGDQRAGVSMQLKRKSGAATTRTMEIATLEVANDGTRSIVLFDSPLDVKGTKVLTYSHDEQDDEQWIYLPAFKRVKQIADASKTTAFMGSEFTYEDLNSLNIQLDKFSYRYVKTEDINETPCFVVERVPLYPRSGYRRQVVWIDAVKYVVLKVEYYDRKDVLEKTLTLSGYRQYANAFWRAGEMLMTNHQSGDATGLRWTGYTFKTGLAVNDFSAAALKR